MLKYYVILTLEFSNVRSQICTVIFESAHRKLISTTGNYTYQRTAAFAVQKSKKIDDYTQSLCERDIANHLYFFFFTKQKKTDMGL